MSKKTFLAGAVLLVLATSGLGTAIAGEASTRNAAHSASTLGSTDSTTFASLTGIVLDSIHNEPLAGAQVSLSGSARHATTAVDGRFRIDSIEGGVHDISVSHPFPDSIGLALGSKSVAFHPGEQARAVFAVPSERGIRMLLCGQDGAAHNRTVLVGRVARVDSDAPATNAIVELDWIEVGFQPGKGIVNQPRHLSATTNAEGRYVFCNLADSLDATIRAISPTDSSGHLTVSLGDKAVGIQYLFLPPARVAAILRDSTAPSAGAIRGRVVDASGRLLDGATVDVIRGEVSTTTGVDGEFHLTRAPMGSQLLRVRRIGYQESLQPIIVASANAKRFDVELSTTVTALDPVVIRARLSDAAIRSGFEKRAVTGPGHYITAEFLQSHHTRCVFDVIHITGINLRRGRSMCSAGVVPRYRGPSTLGYSGPVLQRDHEPDLSSASIAQVGTGLQECAELYVDDIPEYADLDDRTWHLEWLNPQSVVGIEMYTTGTTPLRFPHRNGCTLILIWTSQFHGRHF